ncbi:MAG: hypothetical protein WBA13_01265 [Microcoleaceae cyanobacterium]
MITYSQLYSWRNLCEWLDSRYFKFAFVDDIEFAVNFGRLKTLPFTYSASGRQARSLLYLDHKIQFISYRYHPALRYWSDRRLRHEFGREVFEKRGWCLVSDWEFKIDFLEQLVLFNQETECLWLPRLEARISQRENRERERIRAAELRDELVRKTNIERYLSGFCPHCLTPVVPLMLDCPSCKSSYE